MTDDSPRERTTGRADSRSRDEPGAGRAAPDATSTARSVGLGLKGGVFATVVMTVFRMPISESLPPTANFWAHYFGGDPDDHPGPAFALHLLYGIVGGGLFGLLFTDTAEESETRAGIELRDLAKGLAFGLGSSLFGTHVVLRHLIGMDLDADETLIFHAGHVIYGLALGAWIGSNR